MVKEADFIRQLNLDETSAQLRPIFRLAEISASNWSARENEAKVRFGTPWNVYNSGIQQYSETYNVVSDQSIPDRLEEVYKAKGKVVCIIFGTDDNPLQEFMHSKNINGEKNVIVITVGLQERYTDDQKRELNTLGHYPLAGILGTPEVFQKIRTTLQDIYTQGAIAEPYADVLITRLIAGWSTMPFASTIGDVYNKIDTSQATPGLLSKEEREEGMAIYNVIQNLPSQERDALLQAYEVWFVREVYSLVYSQNSTIFSEVIGYFAGLLPELVPGTRHTLDIPGFLLCLHRFVVDKNMGFLRADLR